MKKILSILALIVIPFNQAFSDDRIRFDADFESGSLGRVERVDTSSQRRFSFVVHGHFDPANPVDTALAPSANWYYFRITGVKDKRIRIEMPDNGLHGTSYSYDGKNWMHMSLRNSKKGVIEKRFTRDTVYVATFIPYTFTTLQDRIRQWSTRGCCEIDTIGRSVEGRPLQLLHITDAGVPSDKKMRVWIHGRIHPSETPGSWMLDGLIDELCSGSDYARELRSKMEFFILPFTNPDGVFNGLSRSNSEGINLEINYNRGEEQTAAEVVAIKSAFERLTSERPFDVVLNSHSQKDDYATFWIHKAGSTSADFLAKEWTLAGLTCSFNDCIDRTQMSFSNVNSKYAEGWFWDHFDERTMALTVETPYTCYLDNVHGKWTDKENLAGFGQRLLQAIAEYLGVSTSERIIVETPENLRGWKVLGNGYSYMGGDALFSEGGKTRIEYCVERLEGGKYDIYRYVPGECVESGELRPGRHGWKKAGRITVPPEGGSDLKIRVACPDGRADAILLIKR